jgi:hypothetical protein
MLAKEYEAKIDWIGGATKTRKVEHKPQMKQSVNVGLKWT